MGNVLSSKLKLGICSLFFVPLLVQAEIDTSYLTGDTRLACEAILCLSTSQRPSECRPSLRRYFGIHRRKSWQTRRARRSFLNLCPASHADASMVSLLDNIVNAADNCTAEALNKSTRFTGHLLRARRRMNDDSIFYHYEYYYENTTEHKDQLPQYCKAYFQHEYTDFSLAGITPIYIGKKGEGGFWAEYQNKAKAQKQYEAEVARRQKIKEETEQMCHRRGRNRCSW